MWLLEINAYFTYSLVLHIYTNSFKGIFIDKWESQDAKQMKSHWNFCESREIICHDEEMTRAEPKWLNLTRRADRRAY